MNKLFFYPKLALYNLRRNSRMFIPYLLACIGNVAMFYIIAFITFNDGLNSLPGASVFSIMIRFGLFIVAVFAFIFLLYTNSFLMKQRRKELGLYSILGMEKRHIMSVLFFESIYSSIIGVIGGIITGTLLSRLFMMLLLKILRISAPLEYGVSWQGILVAVIFFAFTFFIALIRNAKQVITSKPIELLYSGDKGEREPKTKVVMTVLGVLCLLTGYTISICVEDPVAALLLFFIAVTLVVLGTYFLFIAGSIALLKTLRAKKDYYYTPKHFCTVSGMLYRMKQNAVGLANICILATMVIVMITGTSALYIGGLDALEEEYPQDVVYTIYSFDSPEQSHRSRELVEQYANEQGVEVEQLQTVYQLNIKLGKEGSSYTAQTAENEKPTAFSIITSEEYEFCTGESIQLQNGEAAAYVIKGELPGEFSLLGIDLRMVKIFDRYFLEYNRNYFSTDTIVLIVNPEDYALIDETQKLALGDNAGTAISEISFDLPEGIDQSDALDFINLVSRNLSIEYEASISTTDIFNSTDTYLQVTGGFLFLGVLLGLMFTMAAVLIIYYKQISEGYEDRERFVIMQKVGMSKEEVRGTIRSQIMTVFFLPLAVAVLHLIFASPILCKMLDIFSAGALGIYALCAALTLIGFAGIYAIVYSLTARLYYRIVRF